MLSISNRLPTSKKIKSEARIYGDLILINKSYLFKLFDDIRASAFESFEIDEGCWSESKGSGEVYAFVKRHPRSDCYDTLYGGCQFIFGMWDDDKKSRYSLRWIWLHHSYRRKGVLSKHWEFFTEKYGDFHIQEPISESMKNFITKKRIKNNCAGID